MKATEIMIGDWVLMDLNYLEDDPMYTQPNYQPYKIQNGEDIDLACETNCIGDADVYQPIPLTKEILEKNGFKKVEETECSCTYCTLIPTGYEKDSYTCKFDFYKEPIMGVSTLFNCWGWIPPQNAGMNDIHICNLQNLHQLQHALRLCGIDKEIVL